MRRSIASRAAALLRRGFVVSASATPAPVSRKLILEALEERAVPAALPTVALGLPAQAPFIGAQATFTVNFSNTGDAPGYAPYAYVVLPATGADGAGAAIDDGITFVNGSATYLGSPVTAQAVTIGAGGTAANPFYTQAPAVTGTVGDQVVFFQLPFGSFAAGQPGATVQFRGNVSNLADVNTNLTLRTGGGFALGATPLDEGASDPAILASESSRVIAPQLFTITKVYDGPELETATGPDFQQTYTITVSVAPGQTLTNFDLTDFLPSNHQFVGVDSATGNGATTVTTPGTNTATTTTPGGNVVRRFNQIVGTGGADAVMRVRIYVPRDDSAAARILPLQTGTFTTSDNFARGSSNWTPIDARDAAGAVTGDSNVVTITDKSIATQKSVRVVSGGTAAGDAQHGAILEYTINFQVSDYFAFDQVNFADVISDGQDVLASFTPTYTINGRSATAGSFSNSNFIVNGAFDPVSGSRGLAFNLSQQLTDTGVSPRLIGGGIGSTGTGNTANLPPNTSTMPNAPTTGTITFRTQVRSTYNVKRSNNADVKQGDIISNTVNVTGRVLDYSTLAPYGDNRTRTDNSAASVVVPVGTPAKSLYAINGNTNFPAGDRVTPGDVITYRLTYTLPTSNVENLVLTDYLPLPVFRSAEVTSFTAATTGIPVAGTAQYGPSDTYHTNLSSFAPPTISTAASTNTVVFTFPANLDRPTATTTTVDILFSVTVTSDPFADGLFLTNQLAVRENNTDPVVTQTNAIVGFQVGEPLLITSTKGVIATDGIGTLSATAGPVTFSAPGSAGNRFSGTITSTGLAATRVNANITGVQAHDRVSFAVIVENTGQPRRGVFDITLTDTIPAGFKIPASGLNLRITDGAGTVLTFTDLGGGLFGNGIRLDDPSANQGSLAAFSATSGANIAVITYDLEAANPTDVTPVTAGQVLTNTATITRYAGLEGGTTYAPIADTATATISTPTVAKTLVGTSIVSGVNTNNQAVIGELATYRLVLTVPQGVTPSMVLTDTLPTGLTFVDISTSSVSPGVTFTGSLTPTQSGRTLTFNLGNVTNTTNSSSTPETITIEFRAIVANVAGNQSGTRLTNNAAVTVSGTQVSTASNNTLTVIEPNVTTTKTVTVNGVVNGQGDAGDPVVYTITLANPSSGSTTAFNIGFNDPLPTQLGSPSLTSVTGGILTAADFEIVGGALRLNPTARPSGFTLQPGESVVLTVSGTLTLGSETTTQVSNIATTTFTSLPTGDPNEASERTGAGGVNDYLTTGTANFNILAPIPTKTVVATSETSTTNSDVVIGEIVRYRLTVQVAEGTSTALQLNDLLPTGVAFLNDGTARAGLVANGLGLTSTTIGAGANITGAAGNVTPTFTIPGSAITVNASGQPIFDFGTIVNSDNDADAEFVVVEFNSLVTNVATNQAGVNLDNTFNVLRNGAIAATSSSARVTVREPNITVTKLPSSPSGDAGDSITYTVTYQNTGPVAAFDVVLADNLPAGVLTRTGTINVSVSGGSSVADTSATSGNNVNVRFAQLDAGSTVTVSYTATLLQAVTPNQAIVNTATVTYTSLPGTGTASNPTGSTTPGATGANNGERNGSGGVNDYVISNQATVRVPTPTLTKTVIATSNPNTGTNQGDPTRPDLTIGEQATFRLTITAREGTSTLSLADSLPAGFTYVSSQVVSIGSNITGSALAVGASGSQSGGIVTFNFGTINNQADNTSDAADTIVVDVIAQVADVVANVSGRTLTNTAILDYGTGTTTANAATDVVTPSLTFVKSANTARVDADDVVTYTLIVSHAAGSTAAANDLVIRDPLGANLTLVVGSVTTTQGSVTTGNTAGDGTIVVSIPTLALGQSATITFRATVARTAAPGATVPNTATLGYDTMPGTVIGERPSSTTSGTSVTVNSNGISGFVYADANNNGTFENSESPIANVTVTLTGSDTLGNNVSLTTQTANNGSYSFTGLRPGNYTLTETQPANFNTGRNTVGTLFGGTAGSAPADTITSINIPIGSNATGLRYNFGELVPSTIAGKVYIDVNNDGIPQALEAGISLVRVTLTGTDVFGNAVSTSTLTALDGTYSFTNLTPGTYQIVENQPLLFNDGTDRIGSAGGTQTVFATPDTISNIVLGQNIAAVNYDFGERGIGLSGRVYQDANRNGVDNADAGIGGVTITLRNQLLQIVGTTTTAPDGTYNFFNLPVGIYSITETQPTGYGSSTANVITATLPLTGLFNQDFGDTLSTLAGQVYRDDDNSGLRNGSEPAIGNVTITLTGNDDAGTVISRTATTAPDGSYVFTNLLSGSYVISETQPANFSDGLDRIGSAGGTQTANGATDRIALTLPVSVDAVNYDFGERGVGLSGRVFYDANKNGIDNTEAGIANVQITLVNTVTNETFTTLTANDGSYSFSNLPTGSYTITEAQPFGYGSSTANTLNVTLPPTGLTNQNFGDTLGSLAGQVYRDDDNSGLRNGAEPALAGVTVSLTGTNAAGTSITLSTTTATDGSYSFANLLAGTYVVSEVQPISYTDGIDRIGSTGGVQTASGAIDSVTVALPSATDAINYDFGERGVGLSGRVFYDTNKNGIDNTETGIGNVQITVVNTVTTETFTTLTANDGSYSFSNLPTGSYTITEAQPLGYGSSTANTLNVTLPLTGLTNQNFGDTLGSLAGQVYRDDDNSGLRNGTEPALAGVTVTLTGTNAAGTAISLSTTTATDGSYSFANLLSGTYTVSESQPSAYNDGLDRIGSAAGTQTSTGAIDSVVVTLPAATDAINYDFGERGVGLSGRVFYDANKNGVDNTETGIGNVQITVVNTVTNETFTTLTANDGSYAFANLPSGSYTITEAQPLGYGSSTANTLNVTLPLTGLTNQNFGDTLGSLAGQVYRDDDNSGLRNGTEPALAGVTVTLTGTNAAGTAISLSTTTATDGSYSFANLLSGTYTVSESQPSAYNDGLDRIGSAGGTQTSTGATDSVVVTLPSATDAINYDFGERGVSLSGRVFYDANKNGVDNTETGIGNVQITVVNTVTNETFTTLTANDGSYSFSNLPTGSYTITEAQPLGYGSSTANTLNVTLPLTGLTNQNFGDTLGSLTGQVYRDDDNSGLRNAAEPAIAGVTVTLTGTNAAGTLISLSTTTATDGSYSFANLLAGSYTVSESQPANYNDGLDRIGSTGGTQTAIGAIDSVAVTLPAATDAVNYDFGERGVGLSGRVFYDANKNGIDNTEVGIGNVQITLVNTVTNETFTTLTANDGSYSFSNLPTGSYTITEAQPLGYGSSTANTLNVTLPLTGLTNQNFGDTLGSLAGQVYRDDDNSGLRNGTEPALAGVTVTLTGTNAAGTAISLSTTTATDGSYSFANLLSGTYTVSESQPSAYNDGFDRIGSAGGTQTASGAIDTVSVTLPAATDAVNYDFGERGVGLSGRVFYDANRNGVDNTETGIGNVLITLTNTVTNEVFTTTTATDGTYSFAGLPAGSYTITEAQPLGYGSSTANTLNVTLPLTGLTNQNFGDTLGTLAGQVYRDDDNSGLRNGAEPALANITVTLTGTDAAGNTVSRSTLSAADGSYSFRDLLAGSYAVNESQPALYNDGLDRIGSVGGTQTSTGAIDTVSLTLPAATDAVNYDFGERGTTLSGRVFYDANRNGIDNTETGIANVLVTLVNTTTNETFTTRTLFDGSYSFANLPAGSYTIAEAQPAGYGSSTPDTLAVTLPLAGLTNQNFGDTLGSLAGFTYFDRNNDGTRQVGEPAISGVTITLTGRDAAGNSVSRTAVSATDGSYSFRDLLAGTYTLTETQPSSYTDGLDAAGSVGGSAGNDVIAGIPLAAATDGVNYLFGERGTSLSGTVYFDADQNTLFGNGESGLAGITVTLLNLTDSSTITATTDASGNYRFDNLLPGTYRLTETQPTGYGSSTPNTIDVSLPITGLTNQNFGDTRGSLAGSVYIDANNDGIRQSTETGIAGALVTLAGPVTRTTTTDANGNYLFTNLAGGSYTLTETQPAPYIDGLETVGTVGGVSTTNDRFDTVSLPDGINATGYLFGESLPTSAFVAGRVYVDADRSATPQPGEVGLAGVNLVLLNSQNVVVARTVTGADGTYAFLNVTPGTYIVREEQPGGYGSSTPNDRTVTVPAAGIGGQDFGETLGSLTGVGYVDANDDGIPQATETPIAGVTVTLTGSDVNGLTVSRTAITDANGRYLFAGLLAGSYTLTESQPVAYADGSDRVGSAGGILGNDATTSIPLGGGVDGVNYDFGERGATLTGTVYYDVNADATRAVTDPGIPSVTLRLTRPDGTIVASTVTDATGNYTFNNVPAGDYIVVEVQPFGYGDSTPNQIPVTVPTTGRTGLDFGETLGSLAGFVYLDANDDGLKQNTESGLGGVRVTLTGTDAAGNSVTRTVQSDALGAWRFDDLFAGTYVVTESQPIGYVDGRDTAGSLGGDVTNDRIGNVLLGAGFAATNYLFGEQPAVTNPGTTFVAGTVYIDANRDAIAQSTEAGLSGVTVELVDAGNVVVGTVITDALGNYRFLNVPPGTYTIRETQPLGFASSTPNTLAVTVPVGGLTGQNFGEILASITGTVYVDANNDGVQQSTEPGIVGVALSLSGIDANGATITRTATTDVTGTYLFNNLLGGNYTVTETQPTAYNDGRETSGTASGNTAVNDVISAIALPSGTVATGYLFGERGTTVSGTFFIDTNRNGTLDTTEAGRLGGVPIVLLDTSGKVIARTTTAVDGTYSFTDVPAGNYVVSATTPVGYGVSTPISQSVNVPLTGRSNVNFGATTGSLAGVVYADANDDGIRNTGEKAIRNATVTLTGTDDAGNVINRTIITGVDGTFLFTDLLSGSYTLTEPQPTAYADGRDAIGSAGGARTGTANPDVIGRIPLGAGVEATDYQFGEAGSTITGTVWADTSRDGVIDPTETERFANVTITLMNSTTNETFTAVTDSLGNFSVNGLPAGDYVITETQPIGLGSSTPNVRNITVPVNAVVPNQNFGEVYGSLAGSAFVDVNNDGVRQTTETGIAGAIITLSGTDFAGNVITRTATTDAQGQYLFDRLLAADVNGYIIAEAQPTTFTDGKDAIGTAGGTQTLTGTIDRIGTIALTAGTQATAYDFGETRADLAVVKTINNAKPLLNDTITYTIVVTNNGETQATNVRVTDQLPSGLTNVVITPAQGSYDATTGIWTVGTLNRGASVTMTVTATVSTRSTFTNTAVVSSDMIDPVLTNNTSTVSAVARSAELDLRKQADTTQTSYGSLLVYTFILNNRGPDAATNVVVSDPYPRELFFVAVQSVSHGSFDSRTGRWTVGTLQNGEQARLTVVFQVAQVGRISNTASVSALETDPILSNNVSTATVSSTPSLTNTSKQGFLASTPSGVRLDMASASASITPAQAATLMTTSSMVTTAPSSRVAGISIVAPGTAPVTSAATAATSVPSVITPEPIVSQSNAFNGTVSVSALPVDSSSITGSMVVVSNPGLMDGTQNVLSNGRDVGTSNTATIQQANRAADPSTVASATQTTSTTTRVSLLARTTSEGLDENGFELDEAEQIAGFAWDSKRADWLSETETLLAVYGD